MSPQEAYDSELAATGNLKNAERARRITEMAKMETKRENDKSVFVPIPPGSRENWMKARLHALKEFAKHKLDVEEYKKFINAFALTAMESKYGHRATARITGVQHSTLTDLKNKLALWDSTFYSSAVEFGKSLPGQTCAGLAAEKRRKAKIARILREMSCDELGALLAEVRRMIQEKCENGEEINRK